MSIPRCAPAMSWCGFVQLLFSKEGSRWEVDEYCEPISKIQHDLEDEILFHESCGEITTLAQKDAVKDEPGFLHV